MNNELIVQLDYDYGASAYEIAVANGFIGTEKEWLESLKGEPGKDGLNGKDGINGKDGEPGRDGINGLDGEKGEKGERGYSIYLTTQYVSSPDDLIQESLNIANVVNPNNTAINEGDLILSNNVNSNGRIVCVNNITGYNISYTYFSDFTGPTGPQGIPGVTPDLNGYATEEYVDNKLGDVESLLSEV